MRYYIDAFEPLNGPRLPGAFGRVALGDLKAPKRTKAWRAIRKRAENLEYGPQNVGHYHLVNECGDIIGTALNWRLKT